MDSVNQGACMRLRTDWDSSHSSSESSAGAADLGEGEGTGEGEGEGRPDRMGSPAAARAALRCSPAPPYENGLEGVIPCHT